jgi:hypothetical protein
MDTLWTLLEDSGSILIQILTQWEIAAFRLRNRSISCALLLLPQHWCTRFESHAGHRYKYRFLSVFVFPWLGRDPEEELIPRQRCPTKFLGTRFRNRKTGGLRKHCVSFTTPEVDSRCNYTYGIAIVRNKKIGTSLSMILGRGTVIWRWLYPNMITPVVDRIFEFISDPLISQIYLFYSYRLLYLVHEIFSCILQGFKILKCNF